MLVVEVGVIRKESRQSDFEERTKREGERTEH